MRCTSISLYQPGATRVDSTAIEAFGARAGVCQDHAHAFLACVRSQGVPGRYVSGYLYTEDDTHLASHAWAEAWLGDGWYSFDVTNRLGRPERHLKLAVGLDYLDACPVRWLAPWRRLRADACEGAGQRAAAAGAATVTIHCAPGVIGDCLYA